MPKYSLAGLAEYDLRNILRYTMKTWGRVQTKRYSAGLKDCFQLLAHSPLVGRSCESIRPGLRRFEHGKHVVFYVVLADRVLIVRVLHQKMMPTESRFDPALPSE